MSGFLVANLVGVWRSPAHMSMQGSGGGSDNGLRRAVLLGACAASSYGARLRHVRPRFPIFARVVLHTLESGG